MKAQGKPMLEILNAFPIKWRTLAPYLLLSVALVVSACNDNGAEIPNPSTSRDAFSLSPANFLWGVSSSAYQTEGAHDVDGKGLSNWDYLTHAGVTRYYNGEIHNGDIADAGYFRYEEDVQLIKQLGVNSYRFSVAWSRILPDGKTLNRQGVEYYDKLIRALHANGIRPLITIYHWDMPLTLYKMGGQNNPNFVDWYRRYANVLFDHFGQSADFITFNEPLNEVFELNPMVAALAVDDLNAYHAVFNSEATRAEQATAAHHVLMASAQAINDFRAKRLPGKIGLTLSLSPQIPLNRSSAEDVGAAKLNEEFRNRWFLDPLFFGRYPERLSKKFVSLGWKGASADDLNFIRENRPDFLGVNYYSPTIVFYDSSKPFGVAVSPSNDTDVSYNGPARPESLYDLLMWLKSEYNNPELIITEVGAGFGEKDERMVDSRVDDKLRAKFIVEHAREALRAKKDGVRLSGFFVWSLLDNFEWMCAYKCRFGIVYIDYSDGSLKRTPKLSYYEYAKFLSEQP